MYIIMLLYYKKLQYFFFHLKWKKKLTIKLKQKSSLCLRVFFTQLSQIHLINQPNISMFSISLYSEPDCGFRISISK